MICLQATVQWHGLADLEESSTHRKKTLRDETREILDELTHQVSEHLTYVPMGDDDSPRFRGSIRRVPKTCGDKASTGGSDIIATKKGSPRWSKGGSEIRHTR